MNCPDCGYGDTSIQDTRTTENGNTVRRRRECKECQFRFTTYERKEWKSLRVKKRDGTVEPYEPEKVRTGIKLAVEKRPVTVERISELVGEVTAEIEDRDEQIVAADVIGDIVIEKLHAIDKVAYVRFVSVYKGYSDPEDFRRVLDDLLPDKDIDNSETSTEQNNQDL